MGLNPNPVPFVGREFLGSFGLCTEIELMKKSRFTEQQIAFALRKVEDGTLMRDACRKLGVMTFPIRRSTVYVSFGDVAGCRRTSGA